MTASTTPRTMETRNLLLSPTAVSAAVSGAPDGFGSQDAGGRIWVTVAHMFVCFEDRGNETVSLSGDGLDESRLLPVVFQCVANLPDGRVDAVVGIEEDVLAPELLDDLFAGHKQAPALDQKQEQFHRDAP